MWLPFTSRLLLRTKSARSIGASIASRVTSDTWSERPIVRSLRESNKTAVKLSGKDQFPTTDWRGYEWRGLGKTHHCLSTFRVGNPMWWKKNEASCENLAFENSAFKCPAKMQNHTRILQSFCCFVQGCMVRLCPWFHQQNLTTGRTKLNRIFPGSSGNGCLVPTWTSVKNRELRGLRLSVVPKFKIQSPWQCSCQILVQSHMILIWPGSRVSWTFQKFLRIYYFSNGLWRFKNSRLILIPVWDRLPIQFDGDREIFMALDMSHCLCTTSHISQVKLVISVPFGSHNTEKHTQSMRWSEVCVFTRSQHWSTPECCLN